MRVDLDPSTSIILQHTVTSAGTFAGAEIGRAVYAAGAGASQVIFRAKKLGADFNGYKVRLIDPGRDNAAEAVSYDPAIPNPAELTSYSPDANRLDVILASSGGSITSTAATVAAAVQAYARSPITAAYGSTGAGTVSAVSNVLAGGADPTVVRNTHHKFSSTSSGGLFFFGQGGNIRIRQFEATLNTSTAWTLDVVNLDEGLNEIAAETVRVASGTGTSVFLNQSNCDIILAPLRAIKFLANTYGVARAIAHKDPNFPY
jgi:hypothetical protein